MKDAGALVDVQEALDTPGALLFTFSNEPVPGRWPAVEGRTWRSASATAG